MRAGGIGAPNSLKQVFPRGKIDVSTSDGEATIHLIHDVMGVPHRQKRHIDASENATFNEHGKESTHIGVFVFSETIVELYEQYLGQEAVVVSLNELQGFLQSVYDQVWVVRDVLHRIIDDYFAIWTTVNNCDQFVEHNARSSLILVFLHETRNAERQLIRTIQLDR